MTDFSFFSFLWVPRRPVFDNVNTMEVGGVFLVSESGLFLTDDTGAILLVVDAPTLSQGDLYRYD